MCSSDLLGGFLASLELAYTYAIPFLLERAASPEILTGGWETLAPLLALLAGLLLLTPLVTYGSYLQRTTANHGIGALREALFDHLMRMPMEQAEALKAGDAITLMNSDVEQAGGLFKSYALLNLFRFALLFPLSFGAVITHNAPMAFGALALCALCLAFTLALNPAIRRLKRRGQEILTDVASSLLGLHRGMVVARVFGMGSALLAEYLRVCRALSRVRVRAHVISGLIGMVLQLFRSAAKPAAFLFGLLLVLRGEESIPSVVFIAGMVGVMADASQSLYNFLLHIQSSLACSQRVFQALGLPVEAPRRTSAPPVQAPAQALAFENVSFAYPNGKPVLEGVSFHVGFGEMVALVGRSGGGKTTIVKLALDLYAPTGGKVSLMGRDLAALSRAEARSLVAYVPQGSELFEGTVAENICWGKASCGLAEVTQGVKAANLQTFLAESPNGLQTQVGEGGRLLSGGQRQRVAIARAWVKNAPLFLLDETTAALDAESEAHVLDALDRARANGKALLVIAHRLSTIRRADRILMLENGRIVEEGTHEALMEKQGAYYELTLSAQRGKDGENAFDFEDRL